MWDPRLTSEWSIFVTPPGESLEVAGTQVCLDKLIDGHCAHGCGCEFLSARRVIHFVTRMIVCTADVTPS